MVLALSNSMTIGIGVWLLVRVLERRIGVRRGDARGRRGWPATARAVEPRGRTVAACRLRTQRTRVETAPRRIPHPSTSPNHAAAAAPKPSVPLYTYHRRYLLPARPQAGQAEPGRCRIGVFALAWARCARARARNNRRGERDVFREPPPPSRAARPTSAPLPEARARHPRYPDRVRDGEVPRVPLDHADGVHPVRTGRGERVPARRAATSPTSSRRCSSRRSPGRKTTRTRSKRGSARGAHPAAARVPKASRLRLTCPRAG